MNTKKISHLYLMRHAKSDWADHRLRDFDRPLNKRGRHAADTMGRALARYGIKPDKILCSTAERTRETLHRLLDAAGSAYGHTPQQSFTEALYLASAGDMLKLIQCEAQGHQSLMVIGHNPGLHSLVLGLVGQHKTGPRERNEREIEEMDKLAYKFPTGALAIVSCDTPLATITPGCMRLERFLTPRSFANG